MKEFTASLAELTIIQLQNAGFGRYDDHLWLFPLGWFDKIPNGFECVGIDGKKFEFNSQTTDNDVRYGCLAFGILRHTTP